MLRGTDVDVYIPSPGLTPLPLPSPNARSVDECASDGVVEVADLVDWFVSRRLRCEPTSDAEALALALAVGDPSAVTGAVVGAVADSCDGAC